jgi:hypothetical protein
MTSAGAGEVSSAHSLADLYVAFAALNREVKQLVFLWQTEAPERRPAQLANLGRLHRRVVPLLDDIVSLDARYASYRERLAAAVHRAGNGEHEYVSGLGVDSFHSVWWQLHAELLSALGRERTAADA